MEGNKDEAEKCIHIALKCMKDGEVDRAKRFLHKAQRLYPTSKANDLLNHLNEVRSNGPWKEDGDQKEEEEAHVRHRQHSRGTEKDQTPHSSPAEAPEYTEEQIKKCKDYYEVLGVGKDFAESELKKQYRRLALILHPDKNKAPGAGEAFKAVGNAYAILSDKDKRRQYDLYGSEESTRTTHRHRHYDDYDNFFQSEMTAEELFNMFFGGGFPSSNVYYYRRNGNRYAQRNTYTRHTQDDGAPNYSALFNLMPLLILVFISVMGSWFSSDPLYSLAASSRYPIKRTTSNLQVEYYVKPDFSENFKGSIRRLENSIEDDYITNLRHSCFRERNYKETLLWQARTYGDPVKLRRAQDFRTPACDRLQEIYS